ncbi:TetR/AcrR family transcriptional regulator [Cellulomonas sp. NPDC057328]|uniref:TetR/AcrR family transcriptional regulator n=1 Tax=Cellulomonas sp. NPDC057328 TaxID=3346101 RepID=UPI003630713D
MSVEEQPPGLRERTRRAVHREIAQAASDLFVTQGFEATTIDQIAAAAGISRRSFFRYFASKEDVVLGDVVERGHLLRDVLAQRPPDEDPWQSIAAAFRALRERVGDPTDAEIRVTRLLHDEPALRARRLEKQLAWQEQLVPVLAQRIAARDGVGDGTARHRAAALVACALACLDTAVETWLRTDREGDLEDLWLDAVAAVRGGAARVDGRNPAR